MCISNLLGIKTIDTTKRIYYLDFVRGILILLVLFHHSSAPGGTYVLQFHMAALFILSGITEYILNKKKSFFKYVKSKALRLLVPYLCFETLNLLIFLFEQWFIQKTDFSFESAVVSIVTCINNSYIGLYGRLWFLPAIFVCSVFSYIVKTFSKNNTFVISICCLLMFVLSYVSSNIIPYRLPFTIDIALLGTAFFLTGHIFGKHINCIFESKKYGFDLFLLVVSSALFVLSNKMAQPACYMYANEYNDFPFMVICAMLGSLMTFIISKFLIIVVNRISLLNNIVLWYSINSLTVFPVHLTIKVLFIPLLVAGGLYNWLCLFLAMFTLTIPTVNIINNYFPFLLGKFNFKKASKI